ncbi:MAG: LarC family nickel insertion protein [Planctomycetota bacterium]|nr:LarC family nickel insertion protein [Planctomycetota bacterium]
MPLHLHIDPFAGIAGDMFLGALADVGLDLAEVQRLIERAGMAGQFSLGTQKVMRHGIGAIDLKVKTPEPAATPAVAASPSPTPVFTPVAPAALGPAPLSPAGHAHGHAHVGRVEILAIIARLDIAPRARERATRIVDLLAQAEALVHRSTPDEVHFHEVGAVDSIVDMLGAAIGLELLGVDTVSSGPLPIGRGFVRCAHGKMPLPAPATAYLLRGLATFGVDRTVEMVTPTGAAIVAGLAESVGPPPPMLLRSVGYGAGDRNDADVPNLLRVFLGERTGPAWVSRPPATVSTPLPA